MDKLDLSQPLEAVHRDTGAVVLVSLKRAPNDRAFVVVPELKGGWYHFRLDGSHLCNACPWSIRNADLTAKPSTPSNEELTQRMEKAGEEAIALLKRLVELKRPPSLLSPGATIGEMVRHQQDMEHIVADARKFVSDLPKPVDPIDPDLIEARELVAEHGGYTLEMVQSVRDGKFDKNAPVRMALAALARGRTLAAGKVVAVDYGWR